jgi:hypothetical protein
VTQKEAVRRLKRAHGRALERLVRHAYQEGLDAGLARAHGQGRRGRAIRADATVEGLIERIEQHFALERYGFQVRVVHAASGRRVPGRDLLGKYRLED